MILGRALMEGMNAHRDAIRIATAHGQIKCDGEALEMADLNRPLTDFRGKTIYLYKRALVVGSRIHDENEQLEL